MGRERIVTTANLLTLARIPLAALLWVLPGSLWWLLAIVTIAAITDMLDGLVARSVRMERLRRGEDPGRIGEAQALGAWLDPVCDKLFVLSALGATAVGWEPALIAVPLIAMREVLVAPLFVAAWLAPRLRKRLDLRANRIGKLTTIAQFAAILSIPLAPGATLVFAGVAAVGGAATAASYLWRAAHTRPVTEAEQATAAAPSPEARRGHMA